MRFQDEANQYLTTLRNNGTFLSGRLVGIDGQTATARVTAVTGDSVTEKQVLIYKVNSVFTWKYLNIINNRVRYRQIAGNWEYPQLEKRIVAPISLVLQYPQFEVWFRLNDLPISNINDTIYCYCNTILPEHQALVDSLAGVITIENNPNIIPISTTTTTTV